MKQTLLLCGLSLTYASEDIASGDQILGSDTDADGCISSAGYAWCESQSKCLRDWEEECESGTTIVGDDIDDFGCIASAGYAWCENLEDCVRSWELEGEWAEECGDSVDNSTAEDASTVDDSEIDNSSSGDDTDGSSSDDSDGYYYYDSKAEEWLIQFFSVAGPFLVCVPLFVLYKKRKRKRGVERRNVVIQMLADRSVDSHASDYVVQETVAVKEKKKTSGSGYKAFTNVV